MEHELKHGQALVITGPQGCGKTALARKIAEMNGRFIEANAYELETHRALNALLASEPNTVIYEGFPASEDAQARLKALMASDTMSVRPKFGAPKTVKTPNFIFCSGYADWLPLHDNRRFFVINLGTPA